MTESLKFTSPAPAPVSGVLACADSSGSTENNVRLARVIDIELYGRGTEQHVKIKVGTLRALTDAVELLAKEKETLVGRLDERAEDLGVAAGKLEDWRTFTRHVLDQFFATYPTSNANDDNLRIILKAAIESSRKESARMKGEREGVINLNRNAAEEIKSLNEANDSLKKRTEHLDQTIVDLVRQRDKNGQQANQLANELVEKRKEISRLLEIIDRLHAEIAEKRDIIGAATQRCTALTNDAKAMSKQNSDLAARLANAGLEIANYKQLVEDLKAGTAFDRGTVKRQADTIDRLYGQLNEWHDWATDVICSPSSLGGEALRTAITAAMRKRKDRIESLEQIVKDVVAQRDAWVIWARGYTNAPAGIHSTEQLLSMVKAKVKAAADGIDGPAEHTMCGTLKVTQLKGDVVASDGSWATLKHGNAVIAGSIPASKLTLGEEMKEAIREVVREEMSSALKQAIKNELDKLTM